MQFLCSYFFWPFALIMGVPIEDCRKVSELIGVKIFLKEIIAYQYLGALITNNKRFDAHLASNGTWSYTSFGNDIVLHNATSNATATLINGILMVC